MRAVKRCFRAYCYIFFTKDYGDSIISLFMDSVGVLILFMGIYFSALVMGMALEIMGVIHLNP